MGDISYQTYSTGSSLLDIVNTFVSDERGFNFNGHWMLVVEWSGVSAFGSPIDEASTCIYICIIHTLNAGLNNALAKY